MERAEFETNTGCSIVKQNDAHACSIPKQIPSNQEITDGKNRTDPSPYSILSVIIIAADES